MQQRQVENAYGAVHTNCHSVRGTAFLAEQEGALIEEEIVLCASPVGRQGWRSKTSDALLCQTGIAVLRRSL
eukprot:scaffold1513_cov141-Cylindrotheca_fusiformis.AAC.6